MLKSEHLHDEIKSLEDLSTKLYNEGKIYEAGSIRANVLALKLLLNIRQNQVADMTARNVSLIKPSNRGQQK